MWETEDIYYGIEPKEEEWNPEDDYVCDCDACGDRITKDDDVIGIVCPDGERLIFHENEDIKLTDLLEMIGIEYYCGDAEDVDEILREHHLSSRSCK